MNKMPRVWLTGAGGQLGTALQKLFPSSSHSHTWLPTTRHMLELTNFAAVERYVLFQQPDIILNTAAYTAVDLAEQEVELAYRVNAEVPTFLASFGIPLLHIGTDYVFGGEQRGFPYSEEEPPAPLNVYGRSKWEGEKSVQGKGYVFRTSWLYGPEAWGRSFYGAIKRQGYLSGNTLRVVTDEMSSPTSVFTLARVLMHTIFALDKGKALPLGLYHVADEGAASRFQFAQEILALMGSTARCLPIQQKDLNLPATRPHYSVLDTHKIQQYFPELFRPWQEALKEVITTDKQ